MRIAIGNDHVGIELKQTILEELQSRNIEIIDCGAFNDTRCDYPIYGEKVAELVKQGKADLGVVLCGTGVGISITANKVNGIRAVVCSEPYTAVLSRQHNNTNVLGLGSRVVGKELAKMILGCWLDAKYQDGRHTERLIKITEVEKRQCE